MSHERMTDPRRDFALKVAERLRSAGFQALFAGGCVRDLLLGVVPNDFDVATDARPEQVKPLFRRTCEVGMSFGVLRVIGRKESGDVEVATFRSDGAYLDGRRLESVVFSSPEEDAARRDFTINGMFYDPLKDLVIDYVGGRADLESRTLRAIGVAVERFAEDKLRLLRAARFAARFGLTIEPETWNALKGMACEVTQVSVERIAQELRKMLTHPTRADAMRLTRESGLISAILPLVANLEGTQGWERALDALRSLKEDASFPLAFATLLSFLEGETTDFAGKLARSLKLSNEEVERIDQLVRLKDALVGAEKLPDSTLKRLLALPFVEDLLALHEARHGRDSLEYVKAYQCDLPNGPIDPPPLLSGNDLIAVGMKPGPRFSKELEAIRTAQLDRVLNTKEDALAWIKSRIEAG